MPFEITYVADNVRQWNSTKAGPMNSFRVNLKGPSGEVSENVELAQKAATNPPTVGQQVEGNIDNTEYGLKFKKAYTPGGGGQAKSPEESKRIVRQHTQKVLPDWLELMFTLGLVERPGDKKAFLDLATGVMDWLVADVKKASEA